MSTNPLLTIAPGTRVLAAMSGGVDSAVAAALLAEHGCEVTGVTLKLWCYGQSPVSARACCTIDAIDDARRVAERYNFRYFVVDAEEVFRTRVLQPFLDDYANGRTPYPCALCNQSLKFGDLVIDEPRAQRVRSVRSAVSAGSARSAHRGRTLAPRSRSSRTSTTPTRSAST